MPDTEVWTPPRLQRSLSYESTWQAVVAEHEAEDEVGVAEAFAVVGLAAGAVVPPLASGWADEAVVADVCLVAGKSEACPEGYELLAETPDRQRASALASARVKPMDRQRAGALTCRSARALNQPSDARQCAGAPDRPPARQRARVTIPPN